MSVGCQAYTLEGQLCTALTNVYDLIYTTGDQSLRVYASEELHISMTYLRGVSKTGRFLTTSTTSTSTSTSTTSTTTATTSITTSTSPAPTTTSTTTAPPGCLTSPIANEDRVLEGPSGSLLVDNTTFYVNNQDCSWRIIVADGYFVNITWLNFDVEPSFDSVRVADPCLPFDYYAWEYYDGNTLPPNMLSTSNQMVIHFSSDSSVIYPGFSLAYEAVN
ncbi:cell wall protein DAN4-like [Penaeus chinensis]|uniref:cell wall protein DAN4-like n=1 Tax=Penaeus chinensis TaxID=139456 RepID=UPI001FB592EE|nr:cell wall protein DAN4-like [Penaeus chinensis]